MYLRILVITYTDLKLEKDIKNQSLALRKLPVIKKERNKEKVHHSSCSKKGCRFLETERMIRGGGQKTAFMPAIYFAKISTILI